MHEKWVGSSMSNLKYIHSPDTTINNQITDHDGRWHRKPTQQSAQQLNQRQRWPIQIEEI